MITVQLRNEPAVCRLIERASTAIAVVKAGGFDEHKASGIGPFVTLSRFCPSSRLNVTLVIVPAKASPIESDHMQISFAPGKQATDA